MVRRFFLLRGCVNVTQHRMAVVSAAPTDSTITHTPARSSASMGEPKGIWRD